MAMKIINDFVRPLLIGGIVIWASPMISAVMPVAFAIPLFLGFTVSSLVSAGIAAYIAELVAEWAM